MDEAAVRQALQDHQLRGYDPRDGNIYSHGWCTCRQWNTHQYYHDRPAVEAWIDHVLQAAATEPQEMEGSLG